jgi:hypothetical protein
MHALPRFSFVGAESPRVAPLPIVRTARDARAPPRVRTPRVSTEECGSNDGDACLASMRACCLRYHRAALSCVIPMPCRSLVASVLLASCSPAQRSCGRTRQHVERGMLHTTMSPCITLRSRLFRPCPQIPKIKKSVRRARAV